MDRDPANFGERMSQDGRYTAATPTNPVEPSGMVSTLIWKEAGVSEFLVGKSQRVVLRL
jgi:hypothetical protein